VGRRKGVGCKRGGRARWWLASLRKAEVIKAEAKGFKVVTFRIDALRVVIRETWIKEGRVVGGGKRKGSQALVASQRVSSAKVPLPFHLQGR
jgi:hypothetical protein